MATDVHTFDLNLTLQGYISKFKVNILPNETSYITSYSSPIVTIRLPEAILAIFMRNLLVTIHIGACISEIHDTLVQCTLSPVPLGRGLISMLSV